MGEGVKGKAGFKFMTPGTSPIPGDIKKFILKAALPFCLTVASSSAVFAGDGKAATVSVFDSAIYRDFFSTPKMRNLFTDETLIKYWLDIEIALAQAQAEEGIIPEIAATAIANAARLGNINLAKLRKDNNRTGRPITPLLEQVRTIGGNEVSDYLHWGVTTQDIMDTATSLQIKQGLILLEQQLADVIENIARLADIHRATVMVARTNGQQATPTSFGLHLTTYMMELDRHRQRIHELLPRVAVGQATGAVGTLAAMGSKGLLVRERLMQNLGLRTSVVPWNPSRDNFSETVMVLGLVNGTLGRLANDVMTLSRLEIGEIREGEGGASSTMPQKQNPRASEFISALTRMARIRVSGALEIMDQSDTRTGSPWIVEWSLIPEMFLITSASLDRTNHLLDHLEIYPGKMRENLDITGGYAMSEAVMMHLVGDGNGRDSAYWVLKRAIRNKKNGQTLREVIESSAVLKGIIGSEMEKLLDPAEYLGFAPEMVDMAVKAVHKETLSENSSE